jgi:8-oxo-dGTP pyrophosphatase MutT (NUDIX family)
MKDKNFIDKVSLLYIKDKKVLMAKSRGVDALYTLGGKRQGDETDIETLRREIKEESGADLVLESIEYYGVFLAQAHNKPAGVEVKIVCYVGGLEGQVFPQSEIESLEWCGYDRRGETGPCGKLIFDDLKAKNLID